MQAKLDSLATHRWIVEMLQPPSTRSCTGTWIRGGEVLLRELPSADQVTAERNVRPANIVLSVSIRSRPAPIVMGADVMLP